MKNYMQFFSEVKLELSRVIWPKVDELVGATVVVLFLVAVFALYLGAIDSILFNIVKRIFSYFGI